MMDATSLATIITTAASGIITRLVWDRTFSLNIFRPAEEAERDWRLGEIDFYFDIAALFALALFLNDALRLENFFRLGTAESIIIIAALITYSGLRLTRADRIQVAMSRHRMLSTLGFLLACLIEVLTYRNLFA